jgi:hypothetical protein
MALYDGATLMGLASNPSSTMHQIGTPCTYELPYYSTHRFYKTPVDEGRQVYICGLNCQVPSSQATWLYAAADDCSYGGFVSAPIFTISASPKADAKTQNKHTQNQSDV